MAAKSSSPVACHACMPFQKRHANEHEAFLRKILDTSQSLLRLEATLPSVHEMLRQQCGVFMYSKVGYGCLRSEEWQG